MTPEEGIALECACDLAAALLDKHKEEDCCCESLGSDLSNVARAYPRDCLGVMRMLRDGVESRPCSCCQRTFGLTKASLMRYEYELSVAQIEAILNG